MLTFISETFNNVLWISYFLLSLILKINEFVVKLPQYPPRSLLIHIQQYPTVQYLPQQTLFVSPSNKMKETISVEILKMKTNFTSWTELFAKWQYSCWLTYPGCYLRSGEKVRKTRQRVEACEATAGGQSVNNEQCFSNLLL